MEYVKKYLKYILGGILILFLISSYNKIVTLRNNAETEWSKVESAYQRRNDLIGNLVKTVQGAADFEKETLTQVIEARAKATSVNLDVSNLTAENMAQFQKAQAGLQTAFDKLMLVVERYPDLKANQNFLELQSQLEGTENRINVARDRFNEAVNIYDTKTDKFPGNIFKMIFGFKEMSRYKANPGSENAPDVNFDFSKK